MTQLNVNKTKTAIIEAAKNIIYTEGCGNFKIRNTAQIVGITESAIYHHFKSKEALLLAIVDAIFEPWKAALNKIINSKYDAKEKLLKVSDRIVFHLLEKKLNPLLFFSEAIKPENSRLLEKLKQNLSFFQKTLILIVKQGIDEKVFTPEIDPKKASICLIGIAQTTLIKKTLTLEQSNLKKDTKELFSFFSQLLENKGQNNGK